MFWYVSQHLSAWLILWSYFFSFWSWLLRGIGRYSSCGTCGQSRLPIVFFTWEKGSLEKRGVASMAPRVDGLKPCDRQRIGKQIIAHHLHFTQSLHLKIGISHMSAQSPDSVHKKVPVLPQPLRASRCQGDLLKHRLWLGCGEGLRLCISSELLGPRTSLNNRVVSWTLC